MKTTAPRRIQASFDDVRQKLKLKHLEDKNNLYQKHPSAGEFFTRSGINLSQIRQHSAKVISAGALTGALILNSPKVVKALPAPVNVLNILNAENGSQIMGDVGKKLLLDTLNNVLPEKPRPLIRNEEKLLERVLENLTGVKTRATLEGEHLNTTYGFIGAEQHLRRFPGDSVNLHDKGYISSGMAPGNGAWGLFSQSKDSLDHYSEDVEKWYAVVQTLYLPDWNTRQPYLKNWYKHRKVLIVNCDNGNAVVAAIADSGPAAWTGKQFGGSPEVMDALGGKKYRKGVVLVFFVDDPENKLPLGPVEYDEKISISNGLTYSPS